ncbi:MAG: hypothetical protein ACLVJB_07345 [Christensenellales bacterium]
MRAVHVQRRALRGDDGGALVYAASGRRILLSGAMLRVETGLCVPAGFVGVMLGFAANTAGELAVLAAADFTRFGEHRAGPNRLNG